MGNYDEEEREAREDAEDREGLRSQMDHEEWMHERLIRWE